MKTYVYQAVLTPDEDGGYDVEFPSLPRCFACGDTIAEAAEQAVDAASTYVAVLVRDGLAVLEPEFIEPADGGLSMMVAFSTDEGYIVEGETVSAAGAARALRFPRQDYPHARLGNPHGLPQGPPHLCDRGEHSGAPDRHAPLGQAQAGRGRIAFVRHERWP